MGTLNCPFHVECQFPNSSSKTPSDEMLAQLFCRMRYEDCEILQTILADRPVPVGACPDGNVKGPG